MDYHVETLNAFNFNLPGIIQIDCRGFTHHLNKKHSKKNGSIKIEFIIQLNF